MSHFDRFTSTLDEPEKPKKVGSRLADFGDRIARAFAATDGPPRHASESEGRIEAPFGEDTEQPWERIAARFPIAPDGYDRVAVDQHLSKLERELAELRSSPSEDGAVAAEISRIGEQTSTILMTAHEQAQQITRRAKSQADHCIAEAASRAMAMTQQAEQRLREIDGETDAIWSERAQLIDDVRGVASALVTLAEESGRRFPAEPARTQAPSAPVPVTTSPAPAATSPPPAATSPPPAATSPTAVPTPFPERSPMIASAQGPSTAAAQAQTMVNHQPDDAERDLEDS